MVIIIGGDGRGTGKTSVACALISAFKEMQWTAVKVTRCHHLEDGMCHCKLGGASYASTEETDANRNGDSSRFLRAGARRAVWMRATEDGMERAAAEANALRGEGQPLLIESNAVSALIRHDLFLFVQNGPLQKQSAMAAAKRADAIVCPRKNFAGVSSTVPYFLVNRWDWWSANLESFVREQIASFY